MPADTDTKVKLLDAKVAIVFGLLKEHTLDEAMCILENVKIELERLEIREQEHTEDAKTVAVLEAEAAVTTPA